MWGSATFLDQLRVEVWYRYLRLRDELGPDRVARPSIGLLGALAEVAAPAREGADAAALHAAAYHAGETYEYLVRRWQDPRWREVVTVAIAVGLAGLRGDGETDTSGPGRMAGAFGADLVPAGTRQGTERRPR